MITDDPAYVDFAVARQLAAVRATARAMLLFERTQLRKGAGRNRQEERDDAE
jgi:hypothetical protein